MYKNEITLTLGFTFFFFFLFSFFACDGVDLVYWNLTVVIFFGLVLIFLFCI